jgi:hypothetical protein
MRFPEDGNEGRERILTSEFGSKCGEVKELDPGLRRSHRRD